MVADGPQRPVGGVADPEQMAPAAAPALWPAACQTVAVSANCWRSATMTKSQYCRLDAQGARRPASAFRVSRSSDTGSDV
ncbi:hypothetical protein Ais01nite_74460 [Asanoa ishikariensis]|nr:hypothetical protein Ais01nite_74460 [Asanoa ishikariensis]